MASARPTSTASVRVPPRLRVRDGIEEPSGWAAQTRTYDRFGRVLSPDGRAEWRALRAGVDRIVTEAEGAPGEGEEGATRAEPALATPLTRHVRDER